MIGMMWLWPLQEEIHKGALAMDKMDPNYHEGMELVKDRYSSERRRAKILNFSLAYGKTEYGLSKDFGVPLDEAKQIVERWYKSRPEVRRYTCADVISGGFPACFEVPVVQNHAQFMLLCTAGSTLANCGTRERQERQRVASGADHAGAPQVPARVW
jgi:hypothetical protein